MNGSRDVALLGGKRFAAPRGRFSTEFERRDDGAAIYHASGEIDLSSIEAFSHQLDEALAATETRLVVDLRGVTFCNAAGLAALVNVRQVASERGVQMTLRNCGRMVRRVISICELETLLPDDTGEEPDPRR